MKAFNSIEKELETLTEKELLIWNKGYITCVYGILEQIQDDQIKVLDKLVLLEGQDNKKKAKLLLESRLVVLDAYEKHYRERLKILERIS